MSEDRLLYRPQEVARMLGIGRTHVYVLMSRGELDSVKLGAARRIPAVSVQEFIQRLRNESNSSIDQVRADATRV